jgi:heme-degrading monooxygenase HmoA
MVVEYIRYHIPPERAEEFEQAYARAAESLADSDHCQGWELSRCVEHEEHYILRIEWDSVEGHERGFRSSPQFATFFSAIRPFVNASTRCATTTSRRL